MAGVRSLLLQLIAAALSSLVHEAADPVPGLKYPVHLSPGFLSDTPPRLPPPPEDLRTLRQLAQYLVRHDAVTFLSFLEGKLSSPSPSPPTPPQDLRTLRQLAQYLVRHDAVTFLSFLEGLRGSEGRTCVWIFHDAAHTLFEMVSTA